VSYHTRGISQAYSLSSAEALLHRAQCTLQRSGELCNCKFSLPSPPFF